MIYKSALILFVLLAGSVAAADDSALNSNAKSVTRKCNKKNCGRCPKEIPDFTGTGFCGGCSPTPPIGPLREKVVDFSELPAADLGKTSAILGELPAADLSKASAVGQAQATLNISKPVIVVLQKEQPSIQNSPKIEPNNKKHIEKSDASDVKELEASIFERQEPAVQGGPVQDLKENLVDKNTEIVRVGNVEKLEISDIQPEALDIEGIYEQKINYKSAEEGGETDVEDNEDRVFDAHEVAEVPKFLKVKKTDKTAEDDKTSDNEGDFEEVEDADTDEEIDDENLQTLISALKKNRLKKNSWGQQKKKSWSKSHKTSTKAEILKFVQISHTE